MVKIFTRMNFGRPRENQTVCLKLGTDLLFISVSFYFKIRNGDTY